MARQKKVFMGNPITKGAITSDETGQVTIFQSGNEPCIIEAINLYLETGTEDITVKISKTPHIVWADIFKVTLSPSDFPLNLLDKYPAGEVIYLEPNYKLQINTIVLGSPETHKIHVYTIGGSY